MLKQYIIAECLMQHVYFRTLTLGYVVVYLKTLRAAENNVSTLISKSIFNVRFYVTDVMYNWET